MSITSPFLGCQVVITMFCAFKNLVLLNLDFFFIVHHTTHSLFLSLSLSFSHFFKKIFFISGSHFL
ncbi:hypothetical protein HanPSC8_Chr09g0359621 [Helianthus annuus]|nr:hypothetical protein HanPSC8_Chr09g0359621 [Helianthus annuus]